MKNISVLFIGETWFYETTEFKGFDHFTVGGYEETTKWIKGAFDNDGFEFHHIASHEVHNKFPTTLEDIKKYDLILISDVGANTFLLHPDTFYKSLVTTNKLNLIKEYVEQGGAFGMIGGYLTFQGIDGKGQYKNTAIEEILPVTLLANDDRVELPQGCRLTLGDEKHGILSDFPNEWPVIFGYNRLIPKNHAEILIANGDDPIITIGQFGKGRTLAFATDCAPHWASPDFCEWEFYNVLWRRIATWLVNH
ncbi:glutamine amidotransferase [Neobacillus sp. NPDC093127]|uniref:glutamine amidotransferase n=1 Tax=Neobacillus sp. NPDC093127 TaxID=3364296 RepID=UPI00382875B2